MYQGPPATADVTLPSMCIRALLQGYEIPVVYDVMRKIKGQQMESALWAINQEQHKTQVEKERLEEVLRMFRDVDLSKYKDLTVSDSMTIGEVAQMAGVNPSAIRHWEQEGLISSNRNKDNGYRVFTLTELRKIILISSLRKTKIMIPIVPTTIISLPIMYSRTSRKRKKTSSLKKLESWQYPQLLSV